MAQSATQIYLGQVPVIKTTIFTASSKTVLQSIRINNSIGDSNTNIYIGITPNGGSEQPYLDVDLDGSTQGDEVISRPAQVLNIGDSIQIQAGATGIFTLSLNGTTGID